MDSFFNNLEFNLALLNVFKWFLIISMGFYTIFAFVVIRQITVMKKTIVTKLSPKITTLGYIHFIFSIGVLVGFVVWL